MDLPCKCNKILKFLPESSRTDQLMIALGRLSMANVASKTSTHPICLPAKKKNQKLINYQTHDSKQPLIKKRTWKSDVIFCQFQHRRNLNLSIKVLIHPQHIKQRRVKSSYKTLSYAQANQFNIISPKSTNQDSRNFR